MKKIKSAMEIALEKTKKMKSRGKEELDEIENLKYLKAAVSLARSFLQEKVDAEKIKKNFLRYPEKNRETGINAFINEVAGGLNLKNTPKILEEITMLSSNEKATLACEEAEKIYKSFKQKLNEETARLQQSVSKTLQQKYATEGIGGSAVAGFNIKQLQQWKNITAEAEEKYRQALKNFRARLRHMG